MTSSPNADQQTEISFLSGVNAAGAVVPTSFATWNGDSPATYATGSDYVGRWGGGHAGTPMSLTYSFDPASNWSATERSAFSAAFALYSAETGLSFSEASSGGGISITRGSDGEAIGGTTMRGIATFGSTTMSTITAGQLHIDTSVAAFGPIGSTFSNYGGYPWTVVFHEIGHTLGLGHAGAYGNGGPEDPLTAYDSRGWTVMSYIDPNEASVSAGAPAGGFSWGLNRSDNGGYYGGEPTTPMMLDILALQRLYGQPVSTPLSGGQVFGFNTNISGEIRSFFDFTVNTKPIITLYDAGGGNTLDLSGFASLSTVDLHDGAFSSVATLTNNLGIAFGTRIDTAIGGSGDDRFTANDNSDVIAGGAGTDTIQGGAGNDHLYGQSANGGTDGGDVISGGDGGDYIQGNAGADTLDGGGDADRINGGADNDTISGGNGDDIVNGNRGADIIHGGDGQDMLRGGQEDDQIFGDAGNDQLFGDLGNDVLAGGAGIDVLTGGDGSDRFVFSGPQPTFAAAGQVFYDEIADFAHGGDKIVLGFTVAAGTTATDGVLNQGSTAFATVDAAEAYAQQLLTAAATASVAAVQVGGDTFLFYDSTQASGAHTIDSIVKLDGVTASVLSQGSVADFG